ncbi:MAG: hypothetical protein DRP47_01100 [Candidatus Zixiibacteriota bacterium]|nr:MAG: hypothetical protein DRP47_01100 [candidate division Zixibacteria bacterium]
MLRFLLNCLITAMFLMAIVPQTEARISKVERRYNLINVYGGYATPHGEYDNVGLIEFVDQYGNAVINIPGDSLFDPTWFVGFDYGTLYNRHILCMIGFRYTEHNVQDWLISSVGKFNYRQYDIELNANYMLLDLTKNIISPYAGAGVQAGFTSYSEEGFDDDSQIKLACSINFGADLKIYQNKKGRSFVTISSMNNYNFWGTEDRPMYLNWGAALRYYFR